LLRSRAERRRAVIWWRNVQASLDYQIRGLEAATLIELRSEAEYAFVSDHPERCALIVRPVSSIALMGAAALVLGGCNPNVGSPGVSNGATVADDQIYSRGVHSNDACGVSYTEPITRNGALKIPMCNAGHYGINTGKLTYGKISHSASVELTAYDATLN